MEPIHVFCATIGIVKRRKQCLVLESVANDYSSSPKKKAPRILQPNAYLLLGQLALSRSRIKAWSAVQFTLELL